MDEYRDSRFTSHTFSTDVIHYPLISHSRHADYTSEVSYHRILSQIALVAGALLFSAAAQTFAASWTPPPAAPPQADAYAPLNTGPALQTKAGDICTTSGGGSKCLSAIGSTGAPTLQAVTTAGNTTSNPVIVNNGLSVSNAGGAYTYITLRDDESPNGVKYIHANSNVIGFLNGYGNWATSWDNAGNSWQAGGATIGGTLTVGGNITATAFYYSSDSRLKTNIEPIPNALEKIRNLLGVSFNWKTGDQDPQLGFIAQNVEKVFPEVVATDKNSGMKSVQYGNLVAPLVEAVKELDRQVQSSQARVVSQQKDIGDLQIQIISLQKEIDGLKK